MVWPRLHHVAACSLHVGGTVEQKSSDTVDVEDGWQGDEEKVEIGIDRHSSFYERK